MKQGETAQINLSAANKIIDSTATSIVIGVSPYDLRKLVEIHLKNNNKISIT